MNAAILCLISLLLFQTLLFGALLLQASSDGEFVGHHVNISVRTFTPKPCYTIVLNVWAEFMHIAQ